MRTLLTEIENIENHLLNKGEPEDRLLFQAKLILRPELHNDVLAQQKVYQLVNQYGRKQLKAELQAVHKKLFTEHRHQSFALKIRKLFGLS